MLSQIWKRGRWEPAERLEQTHKLKARLCALQETLVKLWDTLEQLGQFVIVWPMLGEVERKQHVLKGLEEACEHASRGQDLRALCPEIMLKHILAEQGKAFKGFISDYTKGKKSVGKKAVYFLPNEWWEKGVDAYQPLTDDVEFTFGLLTIQRNEIICESMNVYAIVEIIVNQAMFFLSSSISFKHHSVRRARYDPW